MKLIMILLITLSSCTAPITQFGPIVMSDNIDLTRYSNQDFLITPYEYSGEYNSVGYFQVTLFPRAELVQSEKQEGMSPRDEWQISPLDVTKALDSLFSHSKKLGADAVISLKLEHEGYPINNAASNKPSVVVPGLKISGFAIKRKKADDAQPPQGVRGDRGARQ